MTLVYRYILFSLALTVCSYAYSEKLPVSETDDFNGVYKKYQGFSAKSDWLNALPYAEAAYQIGKERFGNSSKNTASLAYNYAVTLLKLKKDKEAKKVLKETLTLYEVVYGKQSKELIPVLMDLGHASAEPFNAKKQKQYYRRALKITEETYGEDSLNYGQRSLEAGITLLSKTLSRDAKRYLYKSHKTFRNLQGEESSKTGIAAFYIGKYELAIKEYENAVVYFNKVLASFEFPDEPSNKLEMSTHAFLVEAYERMGRQDLATKHCLVIGRMTPFNSKQDYQPLVKIAPRYPLRALERGDEGYVVLEFDVDELGFVHNPKIIDGKKTRLFGEAAIDAAKKFRYAPAFKDGEAVVTRGVKNKIIFRMAN